MMKKTIIIFLPNTQSTNVHGLAIHMQVIKIQLWGGYKILESFDVIKTPLFDQNVILDRPCRSATAGAATTAATTHGNISACILCYIF